MATEVFGDAANTTVSSGGTGAPASGTVETWTVSSLGSFPVVSSGGSPTQLHATDIAANTELFEVTNMSGAGNLTWTVTRGADSTTPVTHTAGFTIYQVLPASWLGTLAQLAGDLGGTVAAPVVSKIQGTPITEPPGGTTEFLRGDGTWEVPPGTGGGGLTVSGTQAAALVPVATSGSAVSWNGIFGTRPEWFGTISGTSGDDVAVNAAITAVHNGAAGCPGPVVISQPCAVSATITAQAGVNFYGTGQGNRQVFPDTFTGGYIFPSPSFGTNLPLITIGSPGNPATNPCGIRLDGICLSGLLATGSSAIGCQGILATDTADVHLTGCFLAGFDRSGATGTAVYVTSATAGNGVGLNIQNSVISSSWRGLYATGAGVTDMRLSGNLWHSNQEQVTVGASNLGGGGAQITNDHFTFSTMGSTGWHLSLGSQAGDYMFSNCYIDQANSAVPVQLATAKGLMANCQFLATSTSTATSLVKLSTSSQEINFSGNNCNANGSSITALFQTSAHSGAPTGGAYVANTVYGTAPDLIAVLIDSASTAIAAASTSSLYVAGNVSYA